MVDEGEKASDIIQRVDILRVIYWLKSAWENVFPDTIKHVSKMWLQRYHSEST